MSGGQNKAGEVLAARKNELSVVAQDQNWRSYVANELTCADKWDQDWGFLGGKGQGKWLSSILKRIYEFRNNCSHFSQRQ